MGGVSLLIPSDFGTAVSIPIIALAAEKADRKIKVSCSV